jgi:hypothetical protein
MGKTFPYIDLKNMAEILQFINNYELWIYLGLSLVGLLNLRKLILALQEWRGTFFGLERDIIQRRISEAVSILVLLFCIGIIVFGLNSFVYPGLTLDQALATPTLSPLATAAATLPSSTSQPSGGQSLMTTQVVPSENGCVPGKVELSYPTNSAVLSGVVEIKGLIKVNNFGFYKYEFAPNGNPTYATIAAGHEANPANNVLGSWDTSMLVPGDYQLRLVVEDNGNLLPACVVSVTIVAPTKAP